MSFGKKVQAFLSPARRSLPIIDKNERANTINICIGHKPFLGSSLGYIDVMISPVPHVINGAFRLIVTDDTKFGPHGHSLSEYNQLFALLEKFDEIVNDHEFVRLIQYRKFVSEHIYGEQSNWPYARRLPSRQLDRCTIEFGRHCARELVSKSLGLPESGSGVARHYANCHKIEDLFIFSLFLIREGILSETAAAEFIAEPDLIPSGSLGVFRRDTLKKILIKLASAAKFPSVAQFIPRDGSQRRNAGFLLERLHSHLIYSHMRDTGSNIATGQIIVLGDSRKLRTSQ